MAIIHVMNADVNRNASFTEMEDDALTIKGLSEGKLLSTMWSPEDIRAAAGPLADCVGGPLFCARISLNEKAIQVLRPLIAPVCELVPYTYDGSQYWALYIVNATDCLDNERTEYWTHVRCPTGIRRIAFVPEKLPSAQIFRLPDGFEYYVTETFRQAVRNAGITGLKFRFVWSSDGTQPPIDEPSDLDTASAAPMRIPAKRTKRVKLLERLWDGIERFGSTEWLDEELSSEYQDSNDSRDFLSTGKRALAEMIRLNVPRDRIAQFCRSLAYQAVFETLVAIEEEGFDKAAALKALHEDLLMADPHR